MILKIQTRKVYGKTLSYPMCDAAKKLASIKHAKNPTFTPKDILILKEIGIVFEQIPQFL